MDPRDLQIPSHQGLFITIKHTQMKIETIVERLEAKAIKARIDSISKETNPEINTQSPDYLQGQVDAYSDAAEMVKNLVASIKYIKGMLGI